MPKRFRLTRRFPVAMTEDGYRRLRRFAAEAGLDEGEALSFLFENFDSVIDTDTAPVQFRAGGAQDMRPVPDTEQDGLRRALSGQDDDAACRGRRGPR